MDCELLLQPGLAAFPLPGRSVAGVGRPGKREGVVGGAAQLQYPILSGRLTLLGNSLGEFVPRGVGSWFMVLTAHSPRERGSAIHAIGRWNTSRRVCLGAPRPMRMVRMIAMTWRLLNSMAVCNGSLISGATLPCMGGPSEGASSNCLVLGSTPSMVPVTCVVRSSTLAGLSRSATHSNSTVADRS